MRELVPSDIITEKLLRDGKLKRTETEVEDALESRFYPDRQHIHSYTEHQLKPDKCRIFIPKIMQLYTVFYYNSE